jgi:hypothetical protein
LSDLRQNFEELERENYDFKDLFAYIRNKPENEAFELYRRLRKSDDPFTTLQQFRDAETLLAFPTHAAPSGTGQKFMHEIEVDALAKSPLRVPARPWTSVAGDGIVSRLISSFFKWDDCIMYPFVDRELFLRDMRSSDPSSSQYCSSLLVNIMCATRSVSTHGQLSDSRADVLIAHVGQSQVRENDHGQRSWRRLPHGGEEACRRGVEQNVLDDGPRSLHAGSLLLLRRKQSRREHVSVRRVANASQDEAWGAACHAQR